MSTAPIPEVVSRVVLASPDRLVRDLLRLAFAERGIIVVGETATWPELDDLIGSEEPDVVVAAVELADGPLDDRVEAMAGRAKVLVLCDDASPERLTVLLAAGVSGCLHHDTSPAAVADGVESVTRGQAVLHPVAATTIIEQWHRMRGQPERAKRRTEALTDREQEILVAMADGLPTKSIAARFGISPKTVENHKTRIFSKLGVRTQAHAVRLAIQHGLLADEVLDLTDAE